MVSQNEKQSKPYLRYIVEFFLVFFSVFAAFLFENYRVELEEENNYLNSLRDFQADIRKNIHNFEFEIDSNATGSLGYRNKFQKEYNDLIQLGLTNQVDEFMVKSLIYFKLEHIAPIEWIFASVQYDKVMLNYFQYIKNQNLKNSFTLYQRRFTQRKTGRLDELTALSKLVELIDQNYKVIPLNNQILKQSPLIEKNDMFYQFLASTENKKQFRRDRNQFINLIYTIKKLNEMTIFYNIRNIETLTDLDSLINIELSLW